MDLIVRYDDRDARLVLFALVSIAFVLALAYLSTHVIGLASPGGAVYTFVDLDREASFPTWYSSIQLLAIGAVLLLAAANNRHRLVSSQFLTAGAAVFAFLAADEAVGIHERINGLMSSLPMLAFEDGHGAWLSLYAVAGVGLCALAARQLLALWRHYRREAFIATIGFAILVLGAVGFEIISYLFLRSADADASLYYIEVLLEELLEMSGAAVILYATLLLVLRVASPSPPIRAEADVVQAPR